MKKILAILTTLLLVFTMFSCETNDNEPPVLPPGGGNETDGGIQTVFYDGPDPTTQTAKLTGGTTFIGNSSNNGGNKSLSGSPYGYEIWSGSPSDDAKLIWYGKDQGGGAAFRAEWKNNGNYLGRIGYFWNEGKPYTSYGNLFCAFNFTVDGTYGGWSYIGIYGWAKNSSITTANDLVEYYIVDSSHTGYSFPFVPACSRWSDKESGGSVTCTVCNGTGNSIYKGEFTVDGAVYKIYTALRPADAGAIVTPSSSGFIQYFSVRQSRRSAGVISITEHFKKWDELGMKLGNNMYEAKFKVEVGGGTGSFDSTFLTFQQKD
uniref:endo-1,4-beta-xylanase n=1 Tax=uncultured bacterium contig00064 TaxID=1181547 RepID=A0A806KDL6_9BACT|nr:endo-1,4-beta-xylanase C precursor [uncultured bacterium contig00064]